MSKIILCVDDSATMQTVADITFRGTEFTYVGARSADEGLQKAAAQKPALILVDAQMPGKSGYDFIKAAKASLGDVPMIVLCGNSAPYDAALGAQVGADGTLPKPWDTQTMLDKCIELAKAGVTAKPAAAAAPAAAPKPVVAAPPPASAAAAAAQAARSATVIGMPTIKLPETKVPVAAPVAPAPAPQPKATIAMSAPPVSSSGGMGVAPAKAPAAASSGGAAGGVPAGFAQRMPMIAGNPAKRSQIMERTLAKMQAKLSAATGLSAGSPELDALLKLSSEVVERVVWEVVPELAEQIIRENLTELAARR